MSAQKEPPPVRPNRAPAAFSSTQLLLYFPAAAGAFNATERSTVSPGFTFPGSADGDTPSICAPLSNTSLYAVVQVQVPVFFNRQVLVKLAPGAYFDPSATVTSVTNRIALQGRATVAVAAG